MGDLRGRRHSDTQKVAFVNWQLGGLTNAAGQRWLSSVGQACDVQTRCVSMDVDVCEDMDNLCCHQWRQTLHLKDSANWTGTVRFMSVSQKA